MLDNEGKYSPMAYSLLKQLTGHLELKDKLDYYENRPLSEYPADLQEAINNRPVFPTRHALMRILGKAVVAIEQDLMELGYTIEEIHNNVYASTR